MRRLLLLPLLALCFAQEPTPRQRAASAISDLSALLRELLSTELKAGGYPAAVQSCSETAQLVTEEFGHERGLEIRRVSLRPRNAKDQPDEYEAAKLKAWAALPAAKLPAEDVETVTEEGRRYLRVMKPITLQAMCLGCHGSAAEISPEVRAVLAERYPRDKATGYKAGDLRGAFTVTVPLKD